MGRKFRLCQKKKCYSVTSLPVSIPLDKVQVYPVSVPLSALSFSVSWPRSVYVANPADCLETLQQRIVTADVLPDGK